MPKLIETVTVEVVYKDGTSERVELKATDRSPIRSNTDLGYAAESSYDVGLLDAERMPSTWSREIGLGVQFRGGEATYTPREAPAGAS